jgi:penicillin-binding protein 2
MYGGDWRRPPMPAQFALRVTILGGIGIALFAIIFLRLWYLQVLSGDSYRAEAQNNQVREFVVRAPRGDIVDRKGQTLVSNRTALSLEVNLQELPPSRERRTRLWQRVGEVADLTPKKIRHEIKVQKRDNPGTPITLDRDVSYDTVYYLRENQEKFPGVTVERVYVRQYPQGTLAAHLLGYTGEADKEELNEPANETLVPGDQIGKAGVELAYDSLLRGVNGMSRFQVDASGTPTGRTLTETPPKPGNNLVLSIDSAVEAAGQAAVSDYGSGGFVAMNIHNGEIVGLGSSPTFDPAVLAKPFVSQAQAEQIFGDPDDSASTIAAPAFNRATQGLYPTGSTFKPVTALAALDSGELGLDEIINDTGEFPLGDGQVLHNAGDAVHGPIDLRRALEVSSDVFFYTLGFGMDEADRPEGGPLQEWARMLGMGQPTGLDVGGEGSGLLPTPEWRNELYAKSQEPDSPAGKEVVPDDFYEWGGLDRPWTVGDNVNLAIGQGDLQANPLQMAVAYAAVANGGTVVTPHVGMRIEDQDGRVIQEIEPAPKREVPIRPEWQQTIMSGLHDAAQQPDGTSYPVFGGYPLGIAGKTGTAERGVGRADQSWYVALAPYPDPKYVVATTIEQGGFGVDTAAPAARAILNELLNVNPEKVEDVGSTVGAYE